MPKTVLDHLNVFHGAQDLQKTLERLKGELNDFKKGLAELHSDHENLEKAIKGCKFNHQQTDEDQEREHFRVMMDVTDFQDVDVEIVGKCLVIQAKHDFVVDDHGIVSRKFTRKFEIPDNVDTEKCRSLIDCYNVLTVEAPLKPKDVGIRKIEVLSETGSQPTGWYRQEPIDDLKRGYEEFTRAIKDGMAMKEIAHKFAKLSSFGYLPK